MLLEELDQVVDYGVAIILDIHEPSLIVVHLERVHSRDFTLSQSFDDTRSGFCSQS